MRLTERGLEEGRTGDGCVYFSWDVYLVITVLQTSCRIFLFSLWTSFSKKKQAKQNVEMKMWSSSRPDLKLGDVTPNRLGLFLSLFPFFLILNFFTEWLQTFLWEKRDSVFTRRDHSGILMSQHKARVLQLPTRPLDIGKGSPFTIWMKARWGSSEDMLSLLGECGRKWSTKREKLL